MDPVFTLQWPEFLLAERLQRLFPKSENFSVLVPASRQEKGIDLAVVHKRPGSRSRVALLQVKASRTYTPVPPKRATTHWFRFNTWFNRFEPSTHADFFLLLGMYAPDPARTKRVVSKWYKECTLLFALAVMPDLMSSCRTVSGTPDKMFGFGFDDEHKIVQTRGDQHRSGADFTSHLLVNRASLLRQHLAGTV